VGEKGLGLHYYLFNIGDYQSHTGHLDEIEDLAYRRMLDWCYLHEKPLPSNIDEIARLVRMRSHTKSIANVVREFFALTESGYWSERVGREIAIVNAKSEKAKASANARWKEKHSKNNGSGIDANAMRTHSESNATQDPRPITQDPRPKKAKAVVTAPPDGVSQEVWDSFMAIRKAKRAPMTTVALAGIEKEAQRAGIGLEQALAMACARGWQSFKAAWAKEQVTASEARQQSMAQLTRGLAVPKPAAKPFWEKTDQPAEVSHVERKRLL
jgi:uncharacterized protein YdaU (DUF1376 family)